VLSHGSAIQEEDLPEKIRRILPNASSFSVDLPDEESAWKQRCAN